MNKDKIEILNKEIDNRLFEYSDIKFKEFHSKLCNNTKYEIIGVRIPVLRKYAKELYEKYSIDDLEYINEDYYEKIMIKGLLIGLQRKNNIDDVIKQIEKFVPKIDNWAICDTFCSSLKITLKHKKEMRKITNNYLKSQNEFEIRFAIVMLLDYYICEENLNDIFDICNNIKHEGYYVKMAIAWLISIICIKYYDKCYRFLKTCNLDDFTYNKAIQKSIESYRIDKIHKEELKKIKRK